jgi:hypothetical protein
MNARILLNVQLTYNIKDDKFYWLINRRKGLINSRIETVLIDAEKAIYVLTDTFKNWGL